MMKSIKPGRGPSLQGGLANVFAGIFGVIWTIGAAAMGAPAFFVLFGVLFVVFAVVRAGFSFYNAIAQNRHSIMDIVDEYEEIDPLNAYFGKGGEGHAPEESREDAAAKKGFCPYCGDRVQGDFVFCPRCGRELPRE